MSGPQFVTVPLPALCHVALAGATGAGKSSLNRMLLSQLLYIGCYVAIADPHYTSLDRESGEDWRPIERRLAIEPAASASEIKDVLKRAAATELPKRLERRRRSQPVGKPFFLAMDELPSIVNKVPDAPDYMTEIAREGRKVGLYLVTAAQDFMVKSIGSSAIRDNFRTAIYVGGDQTTARVLLDTRGTVDDGSLGKGVVMVRSQAIPQASLMRVPYASNDSLYRLLPVNSRESVNDSVNGFDDPVEPTQGVVNSTRKRLPEPQEEVVPASNTTGNNTSISDETMQIILTKLEKLDHLEHVIQKQAVTVVPEPETPVTKQAVTPETEPVTNPVTNPVTEPAALLPAVPGVLPDEVKSVVDAYLAGIAKREICAHLGWGSGKYSRIVKPVLDQFLDQEQIVTGR